MDDGQDLDDYVAPAMNGGFMGGAGHGGMGGGGRAPPRDRDVKFQVGNRRRRRGTHSLFGVTIAFPAGGVNLLSLKTTHRSPSYTDE